MSLYPVGRPTVPGTHCPCGNQRRAAMRCCRSCARYFWARERALRPIVPRPAVCRWCFELPRELCPGITAPTVALAVRVSRAVARKTAPGS